MKALFAAALFTACLAARPAAALVPGEGLPETGRYAKLMVGFANPTGVDARLGYGVEFGYGFVTDWTLSAFGYYSENQYFEKNDESLAQYGLGLDYRWTPFGDDAPVRVGAKLGASTQSFNLAPPLADKEKTEFAWGPSVALERPLSAAFTAGLEANLLFSGRYSTLNTFGTLKYWF